MLSLEFLSPDELKSRLLETVNVRNGSYRYLEKDLSEKMTAFYSQEMVSQIDSQSVLLAGSDRKLLKKLICLSPLPWEQRLFGRKMGKLTLFEFAGSKNEKTDNEWHSLVDQVIQRARDDAYDFLFAKTYCSAINQIHAMQHGGFLLVDTLLDFAIKRAEIVVSSHKLAEGVPVRLAEPKDLDATVTMVRAGFESHFGRFHSDPNVSPELAEQFYVQWITSSFQGYADFIYVAEANDQIVGCSIWKNPSQLETQIGLPIGHYSLGAVHPMFAGRGIFSHLTQAGLNHFSKDIQWVEGPTHIHNLPVQHAYTRQGWRIRDSRHSFHLWLKK